MTFIDLGPMILTPGSTLDGSEEAWCARRDHLCDPVGMKAVFRLEDTSLKEISLENGLHGSFAL